MRLKIHFHSVGLTFLGFFLASNLYASSVSSSSQNVGLLDKYLHAYYQFNININLMWWDETNVSYQQDTLSSFPAVVDAMDDIMNDQRLSQLQGMDVVTDNWPKAHEVLVDQGLMKNGQADIALISYYRLYMDNVRKAILKMHQDEPSSSQKIKTWISLDRLISTYVELNADIFGAQFRTIDDQDNDIGALVKMVDQNLMKLTQDSSLKKHELKSLERKWKFIRPVMIDSDQQALPYIVLVHGRRMIEMLGNNVGL